MSEKTIEAYNQFKRALDFGKYGERVAERLAKGAQEYGDKSFSKDPAELVQELQAECLDLAGWGFILHSRLEAMRKALEVVEQDRLAKERMAAPVKQAAPTPEKLWGGFYRTGSQEPCRSVSDPRDFKTGGEAWDAVLAFRERYPAAEPKPEPKPAPEEWGVFFRRDYDGGVARSNWEPGTFTSEKAANDAVHRLVRRRRHFEPTEWFAQRITAVHR